MDGRQWSVRSRASDGGIAMARCVTSPVGCAGIGPAAMLHQHGINVRHDAPGVGANLQDHLQIRAVFKVAGVKTLNTQANSLWGKAKAIKLPFKLFDQPRVAQFGGREIHRHGRNAKPRLVPA